MKKPLPLILAALTLAVTACSSPPGGHLGGVVRHQPDAAALGPYSGAVLANGFCFVSGKIGRPGLPFPEEVEAALNALQEELRRSDLGLEHLVAVTVYLTDMALYGEFNAIYASRVPSPYPARVCVAVAALPGGARVEVQGLARIP